MADSNKRAFAGYNKAKTEMEGASIRWFVYLTVRDVHSHICALGKSIETSHMAIVHKHEYLDDR